MATRLPNSGPLAIAIPGIDGATVAAHDTLEAYYRWPARVGGCYQVSGLFFWLNEATVANLRGLSLEMQDDARRDVLTSGVNPPRHKVQPIAWHRLPGGTSVRWQAFSRTVRSGEQWRFVVTNATAGPLTPILFLRLEIPAPMLAQPIRDARGRRVRP